MKTRRARLPSSKALLGAVALSLLGSALTLACKENSEESRVSPCESTLTCGSPCSLGTCSAGQYCNASNQCTADCTPTDGSCGSGKVCGSSGQCVAGGIIDPGTIDPGVVDGGTEGDGGSDACVELKVTFTPQIPTVVMLIDQSGSMNQQFGGGRRWNVLRDALIDTNSGIISTLQSKVRFGLALYTSENGFGAGDPPRICPIITAVPPALDNYAAIAAKYLPDDWKGDTPTGESVDAAVKILDGVTEEGPKVIVLATDGEPDSCADPNPNSPAGSEAARQLSVSAVQAAFQKQISTFVISVGNEVGRDHLRAVANAGQGLAVDVDATNRFYLANDQAELTSAFDTIVSGVRSCIFALNGTVEQASAGTGSVVLDGKALTYMDKDGWRLNAPSVLELQGSACTAIKSGDHDLKVSFPCGVIIPTIPK